jgi:molybdenum cofactor cytidylyltransferase
MTVGVLLLAGGRGERFGCDKRIAHLPNGKRVIDTTIAHVIDSELPLLVCLRKDDIELSDQLTSRGISTVLCHRSVEGMGGTLAEGVGHLPNWNGVVVALGDMTGISSDIYKKVAYQLSLNSIHVPVSRNGYGHPVGFGSSFFRELATLSGDVGARAILQKYRGEIVEVPVDDEEIYRDIDFPADLDRYRF